MDLLEEAQELALSRSAIYPQNLRRYHSRKVHSVSFRERDLVLRWIQNTKGHHKLSSPWEGPFIISKALHDNAYNLTDVREEKTNKPFTPYKEGERPWNAALLRTFYS